MKYKLALATILIALSTSACAGPRHGHHGHGHYHGGSGWVGPMIGGVIIGGILSEAMRPQPPVVVQQPLPPPYNIYRTCREVLTIQIDQYGREFRTPMTVCN